MINRGLYSIILNFLTACFLKDFITGTCIVQASIYMHLLTCLHNECYLQLHQNEKMVAMLVGFLYRELLKWEHFTILR